MRTRLSLSALGALCFLGLTACATSTVTNGAGGTGGSGGSGGSGGDGVGGAGGSSTATSSSSSSSSVSASSSSSASSSASGTGGGGPSLCGNGQLDPGEACDAGDFGGKDCTSFGLGGGTLKCNSFCGIVVASCTPKESCGDSNDNDQDGAIDCDDSDCLLAATCVDSCTPPKLVSLPLLFEFSTTQGRPSAHAASCSPMSGSEIIYQFTASVTDKVTAKLFSFGSDMSLSLRTACGDDTSETACVNTPMSGGQDVETLVIDTVQGTTYFVMVDTAGPVGSQFQFEIQVPFPESFCTDLFDDDGDGYTDCDDPTSCQGNFDCTPGAAAAGEPCFQPSNCAANKGDPVCLPDFLGFPGGYCSEFCDLAVPDCLGDGVCAQIGVSTNGVCLDACVGNGDCRPGYTCQNKGYPKTVCMVPPETSCNDGTDNDGNGLRDCEDPSCQALPDCVPGAKAAGQPCSLSNECFSSTNDPLCISSVNPGWLGGYCSEVCDVKLNDCFGSSQCVNALSFPSGKGQCLRNCSSQADCRAGYACLDVGLPNKVCTF